MLGALLSPRQHVRLRSGLQLQLDLTKENQENIFWLDGDVEPQLYWAIRQLLPLGGIFVDCGANCGLMGLLARQYRSARVIFIEPHPRLAHTVETNIQLNRFEANCELVQAAASDSEGQVTFYENPKGDGAHSIHKDWGNAMRQLGNVPSVTLAKIIAEKALDHIDFLKIDTEGNDFAVLKGLGDFLQPSRIGLIYVEMSRDRDDICSLLAERGYVGFVKKVMKRRVVARMLRTYEKGGRVCFYDPIAKGANSEGEGLWCGSNSPAAVHLAELGTS